MLILPGRASPSFSSWDFGFLVFGFRFIVVWGLLVVSLPSCSCRKEEALCPLPTRLTQSLPGKPNPPCTTQPGFGAPLQSVLGSSCLLFLAAMPRMLHAGGHLIMEIVTAYLGPEDALPQHGTGSASLLPHSLPSKAGCRCFGLALADTPPKEEEGHFPPGCHRLVASVVPHSARTDWSGGWVQQQALMPLLMPTPRASGVAQCPCTHHGPLCSGPPQHR